MHPKTNAKIEVTEDIREWDYGDYEGLTSKTIQEERNKHGEPTWDIWRDGCPGGECVVPSSVFVGVEGLIDVYFAGHQSRSRTDSIASSMISGRDTIVTRLESRGRRPELAMS